MITAPDHLLSLDEWVALPEDTSRAYESQEGVLIAGSTPHLLHQRVVGQPAIALDQQVPPEWGVVFGVEVVTEPGFPASVRVPDVVIHREDTVGGDDVPHFVAEQILVAVEVVADGTRLTDAVTKPVEYARAGIPFYWLMDPGDPVSLVAYRLTDGRYEQTAAVTGMYETREPFPLRVDLDTLSRRAGARERV